MKILLFLCASLKENGFVYIVLICIRRSYYYFNIKIVMATIRILPLALRYVEKVRKWKSKKHRIQREKPFSHWIIFSYNFDMKIKSVASKMSCFMQLLHIHHAQGTWSLLTYTVLWKFLIHWIKNNDKSF